MLTVTRRGVRYTGLLVTPPTTPEPTSWAHDCACAWTAAWLTVRQADEWLGPREVLRDPDLTGQIQWQTQTVRKQCAHRPDLALTIPAGRVVVEVELQRKATKRLDAVLEMYCQWFAGRRIAGVVYVCADQTLADRVRRHALGVELPATATRIELLDTVHAQATRRPA